MVGNVHVPVPFVSVEDAIARKGDPHGESEANLFYDDLVAAHSHATATDLAKSVLRSLGVAEAQQTSNGVRTR